MDPYGLGKESNDLKILTQDILDVEYKRTYNRLQNTSRWQRLNPWHEATFDTGFFTGSERDTLWVYQGKTYTGNEINYLGIGMYEAWRGSSLRDAQRITRLWKAIMYREKPNEAVLEWLEKGYKRYYELNK